MYFPKEASDLFDAGFGTDEVVRRKVLNSEGKPASSRTARRWRLFWKKQKASGAANLVEDEDQVVINLDRHEAKTLDELLEEFQVDLDLWEVDTFSIVKHEVPRKDTIKELEFVEGRISGHITDSGKISVQRMYNIRIVLKRRVIQPFESALDSLLDQLRENPPQFKRSYRATIGEYLLSPQMYDMHFNKRSAGEPYTVQQAASDFTKVGSALLARAQSFDMPIGRIMFPVGNDALHADNLQGTTTKGTWVELAGDQSHAIRAMCESYVTVIEQLAEVAPVDLVLVPGNHDQYSTLWLGMFLEAWFHKHPHVHIDNGSSPRKYYAYGSLLIGMEHGDKVKAQNLVALMATEVPKLWAESTYRVWMRGHMHGKQGMYQPITEQFGMTILTIPALCDTDQYHLLHGFVGNHRAAEGMLFHKKHGLAVNFPVYVDEVT